MHQRLATAAEATAPHMPGCTEQKLISTSSSTWHLLQLLCFGISLCICTPGSPEWQFFLPKPCTNNGTKLTELQANGPVMHVAQNALWQTPPLWFLSPSTLIRSEQSCLWEQRHNWLGWLGWRRAAQDRLGGTAVNVNKTEVKVRA